MVMTSFPLVLVFLVRRVNELPNQRFSYYLFEEKHRLTELNTRLLHMIHQRFVEGFCSSC